MKKAILAAFAVAAMGSTALAADLRAPVAHKAPVYAPAVFNWTGFYVGINGGGGWADVDGAFAAATGFDMSGGFFGAQLGYNWQVNQFVFGVEVDGHWSNISDTIGVPGIATFESNIDFFGSARVRAGVAMQQALFYVTGGIAFASNEITLSAPVIAIPAFSDSQTHVGWTVGLGLEYAFTPNWSAKVEYRYADYGSKDYFNAFLRSGDVDVSTVHVGLNYRF